MSEKTTLTGRLWQHLIEAMMRRGVCAKGGGGALTARHQEGGAM